VQKFVRTTSYR